MIDKPQEIRDPDLQKVEAALRRASHKAKELAERTGTEFVVTPATQDEADGQRRSEKTPS